MPLDESRSLWGGQADPDCLTDRIMSNVDRFPDRVAVVDDQGELTYAELLAWVADIGAQLRAHGATTGSRVAIACHRSAEAVAALVGVTLAGCTYVPLDMEYPRKRLEHMLADSRARVMLYPETAPDLGSDAAAVRIPARPGAGTPSPPDRSWVAEHDPDLAIYVIYTSGSTGWPKGVELQHSCLDNVARWQADVSPAPDLRTAQFAPLNFDVSFQEIFGTLVGGGTLCVVPERLRRDPVGLLAWLAAQRIQRLFLPFVALQMLAEAAAFTPDADDLVLVEVNVAGEQLVCSDVVRQFFARRPDSRLVNHYGQSESAMVSYHILTGAPASWPMLPPIGVPLPGCELLVDVLEPDDGDVGELLVAGLPVSLGYLGQPELNARRYVDIGPTAHGHTRAFRTGDLVRMSESGVRFLNRLDDDIKLRGIRINLAEVEAQLMALPDIAAAVCVVTSGDDRPRALHAAVTVRNPEQPLVEVEVLRRLRETLPAVATPLSILVFDTFPRTPSGKLDRDAVGKEVERLLTTDPTPSMVT